MQIRYISLGNRDYIIMSGCQLVIDSPTRWNAFLDPMVIDTSELIGGIKIGDSLGCSDLALVQFAGLNNLDQVKSRVRTLSFRKENFQLFKNGIDSGIKCTLSNVCRLHQTGVVDTPEGWDASQGDLDKLEKWTHGNIMRFNKAKHNVLPLDWGNS
ncbi:adamts-like protein 1 [Pitangus sulphuratus]|nr:adamts-like protein 1 [Pitangus sulphuratus]